MDESLPPSLRGSTAGTDLPPSLRRSGASSPVDAKAADEQPPPGWEKGGTPMPSNPHGWKQSAVVEPKDSLAGKLGSPFDAALTLGSATAVGIPASLMSPEHAEEFMNRWTRRPQTATGGKMVESIGNLLSGEVGRTLQAIPGVGAEVSSLARLSAPIARQAGVTANAMTEAARSATAPGVSRAIDATLSKVPGVNVKRAMRDMQGEYGELGGRLTQRAEGISDKERLASGEAMRKASASEIQHQANVEAAEKAAATGPDIALTRNLGVDAPKTADEVGEIIRGPLGERVNKAYQDRTDLGNKLFDKARAAGRAMESAGQGFDKSAQGQKLVKDLQTLKSTGPGGYSKLSGPQAKQVDDLISIIQGTKTAPPGGIDPLMDKLRWLREYNEHTAAPIEGAATIDKAFAEKLVKRLQPSLYGWNKALGEADNAYKAASQNLNIFGTESMSKALRGEKFDFRQLAASPSEYPTMFFKDKQSVQQLKAAVGDEAMVQGAAREWAASQLRGKTAKQAQDWATKNAGWLKEAGVDAHVERYAKDLHGHEFNIDRLTRQNEARGKTLAGIKSGAKSDLGSVLERRDARLKLADNVRQVMEAGDPKTMAADFSKKIIPELRTTGLMGEADIAKLAQQVKAIDTTYQGTEKAKRISILAAKWLGAGALVGGGFKAADSILK